MSQAPQSDSDEARLRFCAACGEAVAFDRRSCPSCGHHEPLAHPVDAGPAEPCPLCGKGVPGELIFCPACGRERGAAPEPALRPVDEREQPADVRGLTALVLGLTVLGPLAVLAAAAYVLL